MSRTIFTFTCGCLAPGYEKAMKAQFPEKTCCVRCLYGAKINNYVLWQFCVSVKSKRLKTKEGDVI